MVPPQVARLIKERKLFASPADTTAPVKPKSLFRDKY